jgi:hypothetical protein
MKKKKLQLEHTKRYKFFQTVVLVDSSADLVCASIWATQLLLVRLE